MAYGIGIAYGLGIDKYGKPEIHAEDKLNKLKEMLDSGEIERGIITGSRQNDPRIIRKYFVSEFGVPLGKVYVDMGRNFVSHMYHIAKPVDGWVKNGEIITKNLLHQYMSSGKGSVKEYIDQIYPNGKISSEIILYHIVSYDPADRDRCVLNRAKFDAGWIIPMHHSEIIGVEDRRRPEVIWETDTSEEPRRMKIDLCASKLYKYLRIRPDIATIVASAPYLLSPSFIRKYGKRFLPR